MKNKKLKKHQRLNADGLRRSETMVGRMRIWKHSALRKGLEFNLDVDYLNSIPMTCYYSGRELTLKANQFNTLSVDRIDSKKGYTKDNTVFCCHYVNLAKLDLSKEDFISMCKDVIKHSNQ